MFMRESGKRWWKSLCFACVATERCVYVLPPRLRCEERSGVQLGPAPPHLEECSIGQQAQVCAACSVSKCQSSSFKSGSDWMSSLKILSLVSPNQEIKHASPGFILILTVFGTIWNHCCFTHSLSGALWTLRRCCCLGNRAVLSWKEAPQPPTQTPPAWKTKVCSAHTLVWVHTWV